MIMKLQNFFLLLLSLQLLFLIWSDFIRAIINVSFYVFVLSQKLY